MRKKSNYSGVWINHTPSSFGGGGFRLNGNGYIYGKDVRHATPEEINNHLISIGQIPDYPIRDRSTDDLSNYGLPTEPPSYMYEMKLEHSVSNPKLILSIDDEELPMVDIIKTNSIKQLLNLE